MYEVYSFLSFFLSIMFSSFFWGGGGGGGYFIVTVLSSFFSFNLLCSKTLFISCTLIFVYR